MLVAAWLAVVQWLPTDEDLVARLKAEAEERLGVKVTIGSAHWTLLPTPVVVVNDFRTQQAEPVVIRRLTAHPKTSELLDGKLALARLVIDGAVFPRISVRAFHARPGADALEAGDGALLERLEFRNVTWVSHGGVAVIYDGEIDFDPHWRPRHAELRRPGIKPAFTLTLKREGDADRWQTRIHVGGGTGHGNVELKTAANGAMHLSGELAPRDIEVESMMSSFNRRSVVGGKGSGRTVLSADGKTAGELARSLHTRTTFSVNPATVLRFDLDKAIRTRGKEHDGQTALQELTGQLDTQNTDQGMRATYTGLKARAGQYSATAQVTVYRRQIEASGLFYLAEGATGVPFTVIGPLDKPKFSMAPGALVGAAIVSEIGSFIGGALGWIFNIGQPPVAPAPVAPKKN